MIGKKKETTDLAGVLEVTERIHALLGQVLEKIAGQDGRITTALQEIDQSIEALPGRIVFETRNEVECALIHCRGQCPAFEEVNGRIDALAAAITKRDELEAEIVKLKKILERRGRHHG
jgi:hypothetical protein